MTVWQSSRRFYKEDEPFLELQYIRFSTRTLLHVGSCVVTIVFGLVLTPGYCTVCSRRHPRLFLRSSVISASSYKNCSLAHAATILSLQITLCLAYAKYDRSASAVVRDLAGDL